MYVVIPQHLLAPTALVTLLYVVSGMTSLNPPLVEARPMQNDPEGFQGLRWGTSLEDIDGLLLISSWQHINEYEFAAGPPRIGKASPESVKLSTVDGKFARVTVRYHGQTTHTQLLAYLESQFGRIERMPGSMVRGLNQQYNWRGPETEINLTYQAMGERGFLFIESRTFAPRFTDTLPEHAY